AQALAAGGEEAGLRVGAGEGLAVALLQLRLVVEGVHLAGAARHEEPDDCLGPGGEVRRPGRPHGRRPLAVQEPGQGQRAAAQPRAAEELAPRQRQEGEVTRGGGSAVRHGGWLRKAGAGAGVQSTYRNSLAQSSTWQKSARAASRARSPARPTKPAARSSSAA